MAIRGELPCQSMLVAATKVVKPAGVPSEMQGLRHEIEIHEQ